MLSYSLENFKSFGSRQKIPLKPITLIYGANSSGKSSVIHGYLFIRELLKTGKCDLSSFTIGGELLDLGGYKQYLHKKEYETRTLEIELELENYNLIIKISVDDAKNKKELKSPPYLWSLRVQNIKENYSYEFRRNPSTGEILLELFNDEKITKDKEKIIIELKDIISSQIKLDQIEHGSIIANSLNEIFQTINSNYKNIIYLGPIRSYPTRDISLTNESSEDMDYNAWNIVKKDANVRDKVNKWLGGKDSKLKTGYELSVKKYLDPKDYLESLLKIIANPGAYEHDLKELFELEDEQFYDYLEDFTNKLLEEYDEFKEDRLISYIADKFSKQTIEELIIKDLRTDTTVSHRDIGVGISQVLPVLVSAYASKNSVIAIEQPELHLHPALQSEIADVFIETAKENNNTYLIETHSEHLLLRIMRRIRETTNGELPDGVTSITPNDVQILFVMPNEDKKESIIKKISLRNNGELKDRWPGGFFEESFSEIF
ncbi:DUF3696 domain-containing protein [Aliarcobacter butzleri]|uniref:DUF3696 domain-containing protein n=1 Tax=Aliarcobacter butzleri TaxID=28197 RepID=UPI0024DEB002|nr:DUF3696 domain-containing protein [Aliarcobacter butzleri]MDK2069860.1 DUF3696 domain-containing protein [Aliarcobacter butzleri]